MKILLTGGGSGGHFYPLIAIVEELNAIIDERRLVTPKYYYMSDDPFDEKTLFEYNIEFKMIPAGKQRVYFSPKNLPDMFKTAWGTLLAIWKLFLLFPDVVICKGGYGSFPTVLAAWILRIPMIVHESDSVPGRVNQFAGKFAKRVGIAYEEAAGYFPPKNTALVGIPIRREVAKPVRERAYEYLKLERDVPVILIVGGSQGSVMINNVVIDALPELLKKYQIIHQVGVTNVADIKMTLPIVLAKSENAERYKMFGFLSAVALSMSAGVAKLVVTRAGSTFIFEIADWGLPSIVIPIPEKISRDQHRNAYNYARTGAATLLEQANLTSHILISEIDRIMGNPEIQSKMSEHARAFARPDAARKMAEAILDIVLSHEK